MILGKFVKSIKKFLKHLVKEVTVKQCLITHLTKITIKTFKYRWLDSFKQNLAVLILKGLCHLNHQRPDKDSIEHK